MLTPGGDCTVVLGAGNHNCFRSGRYPSSYRNDERCTVTVTTDVTLSVTAFRTEYDYDYLMVGPQRYEGNSGPDGVVATAGTVMTWFSDGSVTRPGFEICAIPFATNSPTTATPTSTPTLATAAPTFSASSLKWKHMAQYFSELLVEQKIQWKAVEVCALFQKRDSESGK